MTEPIPLHEGDKTVERRLLAEEAKDIIESKAIQAAILALRKRWFAEWTASINDDRDRQLKAQINALEGIPQELQILVNNEAMARKRAK
jgi:hypothetical protein